MKKKIVETCVGKIVKGYEGNQLEIWKAQAWYINPSASETRSTLQSTYIHGVSYN